VEEQKKTLQAITQNMLNELLNKASLEKELQLTHDELENIREKFTALN